MEYAQARARPTRVQPLLASRAQKSDLGVAPHSAIGLLDVDWGGPDHWTAQQHLEFTQALNDSADRLGFKGVILTGQTLFCSPHPSLAKPDTGGLDEILRLVRESPIPIIAAIPGDASGPGFELALACAGRVAVSTTIMSLPGVEAAKLPRFMTLMRLPALAGGEAAAEMVALARPMDGAEAFSRGLVDALDDRDLLGAAGRLIHTLDPTGDARHEATDPIDLQARFFLVRRTLRGAAPGQLAPLAGVRALEAAARIRPRAAKIEIDRIASELSQSQQGAALAHAARVLSGFNSRAKRLDATSCGLEHRLWWPMAREAIHLLDEGAFPAQVDKCFMDYGFPIGPFAKSDALGFEQVFSNGHGALAQDDGWLIYSPTLDLMADSGRLGGDRPGWYQRTAARKGGGFELEVDQLIQSSAISQRLRRKPISDQEIMERCLNAATNASFAALGGRETLTVDDIDSLWVGRLGFPRWKGGLIYQAALGDLDAMISQLAARAARRNTAGAPCEPLTAFARQSDAPLSLAAGE